MPIYFTDGGSGLQLIPKEYEDSVLIHHGIKGQKHGIRRWQNEDGSLTPEGYIHYGIGKGRQSDSSKQQYDGSDTVFVSGKVKYDSPLSGRIKNEIDRIVDAGSKIVIGDAPGADTRVQEYLKQKGYKNVEVFTTDSDARNNVGGWKVNKIDASKYPDEREARAQKDIAMTKAANKGVAISSSDDRPDSATSKNVERLEKQGSGVVVYDYKTENFIKDGSVKNDKPTSGLFETLKRNWRASYLPPDMVDKSKEEIDAWLKKEDEKWKRESEQERKDLQFEKQLRKYDKLSASEQDEVMHEVEKRLEKLRQKKNLTHDERKIEDGLSDWLQTEKEKRKPLEGRDYLDYLMHDKVTNSEVAFDNAVYALSADKSVMNQINKAIHNSKNPLVSEAKTAADEFNKAQKALDDAYDSYSKQWFKDHPGKVFWDGDGTEFHWELEKRYPGYKKISENYEKMVKDFIDKVSKASTISEFRDIKSKNLTNYYDKIFDSNKGVYWYKAANAKAFAIAVAMNGDNARYFIDPMEFIEMFDENWKKFS